MRGKTFPSPRRETGQEKDCIPRELSRSRDREAFVYPVLVEVMRDFQNLNFRKAHCPQQGERGADVRTILPGAAPAVENNFPLMRASFAALLRFLEVLRLGPLAPVSRCGD